MIRIRQYLYCSPFILVIKSNIFSNSIQVMIMKNGSIMESGNHKKLLDLKENYLDLWNKQSLL